MQREIHINDADSSLYSKWTDLIKRPLNTMDVWQNKEEKETSLDLLESPPLRQRRPHQPEEEEKPIPLNSKTITVDLNLVTGHQTNHFYSDDDLEEEENKEDYGDNSGGLPRSNHDASVKKSQAKAQQLRNRQKANQINANRPLRKRNRFAASWKPWQKWILTILVSIPGHAYMPQWLRRLLAPKGFGNFYSASSSSSSSNLWNGVRRQDFIKKTKYWLKKIGSVLLGCVILWFLLPMLFSSLSSSASQRHSKLQAGIVQNLYVRIDDAGISMTNPLSLTDLLYDRSSKTFKIIQDLQAISGHVLNKLWKQGLFKSNTIVNNQDQSMILMEPIQKSTIEKAFSAYRQKELWLHFMESQMISESTANDISKRLQWIQHHCSSQTRTSLINSKVKGIDSWINNDDEKAFPEIAKTYGYLEVDVTELIDPMDAAAAAGGSGSRSFTNTQKQIEKNNRLSKALQNLGQDGPIREQIPLTTNKVSQQIPLLPSPESLRSYRNVSLNDVNILMRFLSVETHRAWLEITQNPLDDAAESNSPTKTVFDISILSASFWSSSEVTETHYQPKTALEKTVSNIVWNMDQVKQAEIRGDSLWTGMATGCICAHHIGLPLPCVAWVDPSTKKPHALFYPSLGKIKESTTTEKGFIFSSLQGLFSDGAASEKVNPILKQDKYPTHHPTKHLLQFRYKDPVENEHSVSSRSRYLGEIKWVEGYDYKGLKRRVRVKSPELACISACLIGCSKGP